MHSSEKNITETELSYLQQHLLAVFETSGLEVSSSKVEENFGVVKMVELLQTVLVLRKSMAQWPEKAKQSKAEQNMTQQ